MPLIVTSIAAFYGLTHFAKGVRVDLAFSIVFFTALFVLIYPVAVYNRKKTSINENLHLFITYAATISTLHISRALLFKKIASKKIFGEISNISEKILYLSKYWNLGFARTCRKLSALNPSNIFADFLDRFAVMMDFGENLEVFLRDEQDQILAEYSTAYMKGLETIKTLQDIFLSISLAVSFGLTIGLMVPLIMDIPITTILKIFVLLILAIDSTLLILISGFAISDKVCHNLPLKNKATKFIIKLMPFTVALSLLILVALLYTKKLPLLITVAISVTPLLVIGYLASREEEMVARRDNQFPTFIRTLGSTIEIKNRAIITSLYSLRVHDFGLLNQMLVNLYRRLRIGTDKYKAWLYFAAESGSNLINHFSTIFAEAFYLGGNAEKIAEIISQTFLTLLSLRKRRAQLVSGFRAVVYGSLVGFCAVAYISIYIVQALSSIFTNYSGNFTDSSKILQGVVGSIIPTSVSIDFGVVTAYVGLVIIIHSFFGALLIKAVDGGSPYAMYQDMVIMIWIGVLISVITPKILTAFMPTFNLTI